ncbi:MAG: transposase [Pseudomonadota bacterium]
MAKREIVTVGTAGMFHCISRCVRRAFLCGNDPSTGKSLEHRNSWVQARLELLARTFAVDICAFTVMPNHLHVVLRIRPDLVESWSDEEIAARWLLAFPKRKTEDGRPVEPSAAEIKDLADQIELMRDRLADVSWFMRNLNENIARQANKEDGCRGRFWEGRSKFQAILDEAALFTCMVFVDLNPVRTGEAAGPEASPRTSAFLRIRARQAREKLALAEKEGQEGQPNLSFEQQKGRETDIASPGADQWLYPFDQDPEEPRPALLDISVDRYLEILDWTSRQFREGGNNSLPGELAAILERLRIDSGQWLETTASFGRSFHLAAGRAELMQETAAALGRRWLRGLNAGKKAFS